MKLVIKILLGLGCVVVVALLALVTTVQMRWDRTFDVAEPALKASADPNMIERGTRQRVVSFRMRAPFMATSR